MNRSFTALAFVSMCVIGCANQVGPEGSDSVEAGSSEIVYADIRASELSHAQLGVVTWKLTAAARQVVVNAVDAQEKTLYRVRFEDLAQDSLLTVNELAPGEQSISHGSSVSEGSLSQQAKEVSHAVFADLSKITIDDDHGLSGGGSELKPEGAGVCRSTIYVQTQCIGAIKMHKHYELWIDWLAGGVQRRGDCHGWQVSGTCKPTPWL